MKNEDVAEMLTDIADMLEIKGESPFRIRAYREAARRIESLHEDVATLAAEARLKDIRGIGESIASKITEFVTTGRSSYRDELAQALPKGISELLAIPGVGARKAQLFHEQLGISTIDELEEAAKTHKLKGLPKIKEKTEQNVLEGIMRLKQRTGRMLLGLALPAAEEVVDQLRPHPAVERVEMGGSIRRMKETIGDIDILVASSKPKDAIEAFTTLPNVKSVLAKGTTKASVLTRQDLQIDCRVVSPDQWGAALQYFTGSKEHNIQLRTIAEGRGLKINEYGLFRTDNNEKVAGREECEIYEALEMKCIPPELREAAGEIEAAAKGQLPSLVELSDIRGDLHAHTNWSDGINTIEEMAGAAKALGYEYLAISDHSVSMGFIHGLTTDRVREQRGIIDDLNEKLDGFRLLQGIEVNIRGDGSLDYSDDVLAQFDVVTASIHSGLGQPRERITARMVAAMENPHVNIIGHPSGRIIGRRDPSAFDENAVYKAAAETGTALEIDGQPDRLDLKDSNARQAAERGAFFAINSDAHATAQLEYMRYGVSTARRGWVEKDRVLNALPVDKLLDRLKAKR
ncbi:MAG: DNA polymerase/3'-5' exonuclease PolX [Armatimonadetes bacterium]|nr:DNA polymerase/3'-5' exonuclease PolX [Armatimonadota bacterium]